MSDDQVRPRPHNRHPQKDRFWPIATKSAYGPHGGSEGVDRPARDRAKPSRSTHRDILRFCTKSVAIGTKQTLL